ncbi:Mitochondrial carrier protein LEU5 [Penicillium canariense]|uniref:Mitochondrial thiamine pyrophosphate carrier 1 n=1 Tax=Penicillium canariense TaxID=189055 RepID=A0A9W9HVC8_9EURO|nr:Mitochondrial carrier protein LEU5 [Penicillium canariense]KAJ5159623.1 Mitochondrial carrier protein LEU5 [Penicillium canariense]
MSTGFPDHAQFDSVVRTPRHGFHPSPESNPQSDSQMSGIAQSRSSPGPIAGGASAQVSPKAGVDTQKSGEAVTKRSVDYVLRSGLAGGLAGCAAKTVVAPLDRVKILFQASNPQFAKYTGSWAGLAAAIRDIKRHEGARGLYKGHSATLLRIFPYAAIKFLAYEQIRAAVIPSHDKETSFRRLVSGSLAGITSVFFTYPLELVRVRLAFETKQSSRSSLTDICRQIYNERTLPPATAKTASATVATAETVASTVKQAGLRSGIANFYRGFGPTILGMLPYAGIFRIETEEGFTTAPAYSCSRAFFSGATAGLVSQSFSYPLEVIRRRMQVSGAVGGGQRLGIIETGRKILLERGIRGFWVGLTIGYMKIIPMSATSFFVYERLKWSLGI